MAEHVVVTERVLARLGKSGTGRPQLQLLFGEPQHQDLPGLHLLPEDTQTIGQARERGVGAYPALLATSDDPLEIFEAVGRLLEQRLDVGRHRSVSRLAQRAGAAPAIR